MTADIFQNPDLVTIGGRFAWALTKALANRHPGWRCLFVMRDRSKVEEAAQTGRVSRFFGDKIDQDPRPGLGRRIKMPGNVDFCSLKRFNRHFRGQVSRVFIPAVPSSQIRGVLTGMLEAGVPGTAFSDCEVLSVSKGMETSTLEFPHEIIDRILGCHSVVALGGNLAYDLSLGDPMLMELAGLKPNVRRASDYFKGSHLIIYETFNRRKLSLAGPMKNIHSLATGMTSEVFGHSSVSTIATMGLSEYERAAFIVQFPRGLRSLARKIRKLPIHFRSVPLAGGAMSDYHLFGFTRNFNAGQAFIREVRNGRSAGQAMAEISKNATIESFSSAFPTRDFLRRLGCYSPVIEMMAHILEGRISPGIGIRKIIRQRNLMPT